VLGEGDVEGLSGIEHRGRKAGSGGRDEEASSVDRSLVSEQQITCVVDQRGQDNGVNQDQRNGISKLGLGFVTRGGVCNVVIPGRWVSAHDVSLVLPRWAPNTSRSLPNRPTDDVGGDRSGEGTGSELEPTAVLDAKPRICNGCTGVAVGVAATEEMRPHPIDSILEPRSAWLFGADLLVEAELATRSQHSANRRQGAVLILHRAQHQGQHGRIERSGFGRQHLRCPFDDTNGHRRTTGSLFG